VADGGRDFDFLHGNWTIRNRRHTRWLEGSDGLATDHSPNGFPDLPVREGEENFVWILRFADQADHASHADRLDLDSRLRARRAQPSSTWRLTPTSRSLLRV
jgi:hypothetical protein